MYPSDDDGAATAAHIDADDVLPDGGDLLDEEFAVDGDGQVADSPEAACVVSDEADAVYARATTLAIAQISANTNLPSPADAAATVLWHTKMLLIEWNRGQLQTFGSDATPRKASSLLPRQAAELVMLYREVAVIPAVDGESTRDRSLLAVYNAAEGLYVECSGRNNDLTAFLRELNYNASTRWIDEVMAALKDLAPLRYQTSDADLVALDDCVYNRRTGERSAYDPAEHVFLAKVRTRLPDAKPELPRIRVDDETWWDPWSWLVETMGSEEMARAIIEITAFVLCPRGFTDDKIVIFLSESGSNGKGTILALLRAIVGGPKGLGCASLGLEMFNGKKEFLLTRLIGAMVNLSDESDADAFLASSALLKALASHDPVQVNRKNRDPIEVVLFLAMIFSLNKLPKMKDKSEAVDRRMHVLRFAQRFMAEGTEIKKNPAIKHDYVLRDEVREWFVWQALVELGPITELSVPEEVANALEEYRGANDAVVVFYRKYRDALDNSQLTTIPLELLYNSFVADSRNSRGSGAGIESERVFTDRFVEEARKDGMWSDERGGARHERVRRALTTWAEANGAEVAVVFGELGRATVETKSFGGAITGWEEIVVGDKNVARWTRAQTNPETRLRAPLIPARGAMLVRDPASVPAPPPPEPARMSLDDLSPSQLRALAFSERALAAPDAIANPARFNVGKLAAAWSQDGQWDEGLAAIVAADPEFIAEGEVAAAKVAAIRVARAIRMAEATAGDPFETTTPNWGTGDGPYEGVPA